MPSQAISPKKRQHLLSHAVELHKNNDLNGAAKIYEKVLTSNPKDPDALNLLGLVYYRKHKYDEAFKLIKTAIGFSPNDAAFHNNIGNIYFDTDQLDKALFHYKKSLSINPKQSDAATNIANILWKLHRNQEAEDTLNAASKNQVKTPAFFHNMGHIYSAQKKYVEAEKLHIQGLAIAPNDPQLRLDTGLMQLSLEKFTEGWNNYSWGGKSVQNIRKFYSLSAPIWDGSPLKEKTILIYGEQGIGDEIMFAQFIPEISMQAKKCIFACLPRLTPIFSRSFPNIEFFSGYDEDILKKLVIEKHVDYASPIGELAKFLRPDSNSFSDKNHYLIPNKNTTSKWKQRYADLGQGLKIGISWKGGKETRSSISRSIDLNQWLPLFKIPNCHFINLQYGEHSKEINHIKNTYNITLHHWQDSIPLNDMDDFAAQTAALDLVISIDNSTVHLAGALGIPTWILLPYSPDWRWGINRQDSLWYNSITLFHQKIQNNWSPVFSEITDRLSSIQTNTAYLPYLSFEQLPSALYLNACSDQNNWGESCTSNVITEMLNKLILKVNSIHRNEIHSFNHQAQTTENVFDHQYHLQLCQANSALTQSIKNSDCLIINGDGLLGNTQSHTLTLLSIAYLAKKLYKKSVYIINISIIPSQKEPNTSLIPFYQNLFNTLDGVATQNATSSHFLQQIEIYHHACFSCIPLFLENNYSTSLIKKNNTIIIAGIDNLKPETLLSLSEYISKLPNHNFKIQILIEAKKINSPGDSEQPLQTLLSEKTKNWDFISIYDLNTLLNTIASAKLLITNHHSTLIIANFVETPTIAIEPSVENKQLTQTLNIHPPLDLTSLNQVNKLIQNTIEITNNPSFFLPTKEHKDSLIKLAKQNFEW